LGVLCEASHLSKKKSFAKKSQQRNAKLINECRQRRVKWNKENKIIIGTWNVRTLLQPGKMQLLAERISKTQLELLAIQEIRWSGTGLIKKQNYSLYYSRPSSKTGQAGTGFILLKKMHHNVTGKYNNIMSINVYAPTEDHTEETKEQFYDNLQHLLDKTPKSDTIII
jgi:exonuclease III